MRFYLPQPDVPKPVKKEDEKSEDKEEEKKEEKVSIPYKKSRSRLSRSPEISIFLSRRGEMELNCKLYD